MCKTGLRLSRLNSKECHVATSLICSALRCVFACDPDGLAHCNVPAHGSEASGAKNVSKNQAIFLGHVLTMSLGNHYFLPEEAWPWPPCWPALFAFVAALDCALAAKPPEDISFPPVAFDIVSKFALDRCIEKDVLESFGCVRHLPKTSGCYLFLGLTC